MRKKIIICVFLLLILIINYFVTSRSELYKKKTTIDILTEYNQNQIYNNVTNKFMKFLIAKNYEKAYDMLYDSMFNNKEELKKFVENEMMAEESGFSFDHFEKIKGEKNTYKAVLTINRPLFTNYKEDNELKYKNKQYVITVKFISLFECKIKFEGEEI